MKSIFVPAAVLLALSSGLAPAMARGCLKGALVGGVTGHIAGHHGLLGAGAGCVVGHHLAKKRDRQRSGEARQGRHAPPRDGRWPKPLAARTDTP